MGIHGCSDRNPNERFSRRKTECGFMSTYYGQPTFLCESTLWSDLIHQIIRALGFERLGYAAASLPWGQVSYLLATVAAVKLQRQQNICNHRITTMQVGFEIVYWLAHLDKSVMHNHNRSPPSIRSGRRPASISFVCVMPALLDAPVARL